MRTVRHSLTWGAAFALSQSIGGLGRLALVAWWVGPQATGSFAIALGVATALGALVESGVRQQFIASPSGATRAALLTQLQSLWKLQIRLRGGLFVGSLLVMPFHGSVGEFALLLPLLMFSTLVQAAGNPSLWWIERRGDLKPLALLDGLGQCLAVLLLLVWYTASAEMPSGYALAAATMVHAVASTVMGWVGYRRFRMRPSTRAARQQAFKDGAPYRRIAVLTFCTYGLDRLVIGSLIGAGNAGVYFTASRIAEAPLVATPIVNRALLPTFAADLRSGSQEWAGLLRRTLWISVMLGALLVAVSAFTALLVRPADADWQAVLQLIPMLLAAVSFRLLCQVLQPALIARGRIAMDARLKLQEAIAYVPVLILSVALAGAMGAAIACFALYLASFLRRLPLAFRATS